MQKLILSDVDGCLLDWESAFAAHAELEKGLVRIKGTSNEFSIAARYGISKEVAGKLISDFNASDAMLDIKPFADAVPFVRMLRSAGYEFKLITSFSSDAAQHEKRRQNLIKYFGEDTFGDMTGLELCTIKTEALAKWKDSGLFWIEDYPPQIEAGLANGLRPILVSQPYNEYYNHPDVSRVSNGTPWQEIYIKITGANNE